MARLMKIIMRRRTKQKWQSTHSPRFAWHLAQWVPFTIFASSAVLAEPFTPASDDEVLLVLPFSASASVEAASLEPLQAAITDAERINRAEFLLKFAYETSDENAFGQAQALLAPWSHSAELAAIPSEVKYMLAVIRQHNHEFTAALALLTEILLQQPTHGAALLQRAQINLVLGNYEESRSDCQQLVRIVSGAAIANCIAQVDAVTGHAAQVQAQLTYLVGLKAQLSPADYTELMITLATVSHRLDHLNEAESYYRQILQLNQTNLYVIQQYTDFLLEQKRFTDVLELLEPMTAQQMNLELRVKRLEALSGIGQAEAYANEHQQLEEIFAVAQTRAENFPYKEYARFLLLNPEQATEALQAARANWQYQKEPADLLLLVRTAQAANSEDGLELARTWLRDTGLEDLRTIRLLRLADSPNKTTTIPNE